MNLFKFFFIFFFPLFVFASDDFFSNSILDHFQKKEFDRSLELLTEWEASQISEKNKLSGMKAAVYLAMGDLEKSKIFMNEFVQNLDAEKISDPLLEFALQVYYKATENIHEGGSGPLTQMCKQEQPKGVKLKYWFGVAQVVLGVLAIPFSGGASTALILSGTVTVVDAAADALNNQENWDRELNERQRIDPDIQNNSFLNPFHWAIQKPQLV